MVHRVNKHAKIGDFTSFLSDFLLKWLQEMVIHQRKMVVQPKKDRIHQNTSETTEKRVARHFVRPEHVCRPGKTAKTVCASLSPWRNVATISYML